jgi:hypothetical protein
MAISTVYDPATGSVSAVVEQPDDRHVTLASRLPSGFSTRTESLPGVVAFTTTRHPAAPVKAKASWFGPGVVPGTAGPPMATGAAPAMSMRRTVVRLVPEPPCCTTIS